MAKTSARLTLRKKRKLRVRKKINGTPERPRLSVFRSDRHIYAQVIDDLAGVTIASVCSYEKGAHMRANLQACESLGKKLAERCKAKNVNAVVFDKNGFLYHGRIKALAEGARSGGLQF